MIHLKWLSVATQRTKLDSNYLQLPGDSRLIAEALSLGCAVISNDELDVHATGGLAGVRVTDQMLRNQI